MRHKLLTCAFLALLPACIASLSAQTSPTQVDVPTWQLNSMHTGANNSETSLNLSNINSSGAFSQLFKQQVDGQVYAQPLYLSSVTSTPFRVSTLTERGIPMGSFTFSPKTQPFMRSTPAPLALPHWDQLSDVFLHAERCCLVRTPYSPGKHN